MEIADFAFGERDDFDARKGHPLEKAGDIFLVAADPVERLCNNDIETGRHGIADQRLNTRANQARTADRAIGIGLNEIPIFPVRSEEHTSELQSLMRISYAVFCLKKKQDNR